MPASHSIDHLCILSGIQPAELRRLGVIVSLAYYKSLEPNHIPHGLLSGFSDVRHERLRSGRPFVPAARNLAGLAIRAYEWMNYTGNMEWINYRWNMEYYENISKDQYQACWDELALNSLGQAQSPAN